MKTFLSLFSVIIVGAIIAVVIIDQKQGIKSGIGDIKWGTSKSEVLAGKEGVEETQEEALTYSTTHEKEFEGIEVKGISYIFVGGKLVGVFVAYPRSKQGEIDSLCSKLVGDARPVMKTKSETAWGLGNGPEMTVGHASLFGDKIFMALSIKHLEEVNPTAAAKVRKEFNNQ